MDNATRIKRLKHFVVVMERVPQEKFLIDNWFNKGAFEEPLDVVVPNNFVHVDCQTSACALGWAALDKTFNEAGLKFNEWEEIVFNACSYEDAGKAFFGLTRDELGNLFYDSSYNSNPVKPKHVIRKLKNLIKKYECNGRILS